MVTIRHNFSKVSSGVCDKPSCGRRPVYRHHKGDEHRFIRYLTDNKFRTKRPWVKRIMDRYHQFHEQDICHVCGDHHEEIHELLFQSLKTFCKSKAITEPIKDWDEDQVLSAITFLRTSTEFWLTQPTPGCKTRILTTFP